MKKVLLILLAVALLCAGCGQETPETVPATVPETTAAPETTAPPETTEATIPVPELTYVTAKTDKVAAVLKTLSRGETVDVVGEYDEDHFVIKTEQGYGLVEKELLRMGTEAAFETRTGYARYNAEFHTNFRLSGEPAQKLRTNTKVTILDDLGWCWLVELDGVTGYISTESVSNSPIKGSGGGGSSSADGGDISLSVPGIVPLFSLVPQEGEVTGQATVLADGTEVVLGWFDRGDEIPVVAEEGFAESREGFHTVYLEDLYAYVEQSLTRAEGEAEYEAWDGYAKYKAALYDNRWTVGEEVQSLKTNTVVHILEELEDSYLVEVDGATGYIPKDMVSKTRITGGSSSSSGGEWSPPAM